MKTMRIISFFVVLPFLATGTPVSKLDLDQSIDLESLRIPEWTGAIDQKSVNGSSSSSSSSSESFFVTPTDEVWQVKLGDICQITRFPLPSSEPSRYLECIRPYDDEKQWPWSDKGIWVLKQCPPGYEFHLMSHSCRTRRYIRRQQSMCNSNPAPQYCPQPQQQQYAVQPQQQMACQCPPSVSICACPQPQGYQPMPMPQQPMPQQPQGGGGGGGNMCPPVQTHCPQPPQPCPMASQSMQSAQAGDVCSWMLAPLAADQTSNKCFLQCVPAPGNAYCGRWVRMPCAPGTIFDVNVQVCVHDPYGTPGQVPPWSQQGGGGQCNQGTAIGSCNVNMQCPGQSTCQMPQQQQPQQSQQCQQQPQQCSVCCYTGSGSGGGLGGGYGGMGGMGGGGGMSGMGGYGGSSGYGGAGGYGGHGGMSGMGGAGMGGMGGMGGGYGKK